MSNLLQKLGDAFKNAFARHPGPNAHPESGTIFVADSSLPATDARSAVNQAALIVKQRGVLEDSLDDLGQITSDAVAKKLGVAVYVPEAMGSDQFGLIAPRLHYYEIRFHSA